MRIPTIIFLILLTSLPACTDQEFISMMCDKPEGIQHTVLCWFLGSASEKQSCYYDKDCEGRCDGVDVMEGRCKDGRCVREYGYSCQENGVDARCFMDGKTPKCTEPEGQCSSDDQCLPKCKDKDVMEGKCQEGRCVYGYAYSCEENGIDARCIMDRGKAECTRPENQCSADDQCEDICKDDMVMDAYCDKRGRCAWTFIERCDTKKTCVVDGGRSFCK